MSVKANKEDGPPMNKPQIAHSFDDKRRTGDILIGENLDFAGLFLSPAVLQGLSKAGFRNPSPIQLKAIPLGRCGLDLIVQAKSGTGKTCVFTVIALEGLLIESCSVQVLVLAPTREIALQIQDVIVTIGQKVTGLMCQSFIGGLPLSLDKERVKTCHVAVGTPGRVKQLIEENILTTDSIRLFVLDEADKLLEEGFQEQINWIYSTLPDNKQMVALSATYPEYLANHLTAYMRNPTFVRLNTLDPALLGIKQFYQELPFQPLPQKAFEEKSKSLIALLSSISFQQCLVFSNLQVAAENLSDLLNSKGWPSAFIAGSQDQKLRMKAMEKLKKYECRVLISTDLTSRGIDADKVDLVVNLDLPWDHETYLHRIGRAGRFGAYGAAVSFVVKGKESTRLADIQEKCHTVIKPLPEPVPSNLTQPVGHVCLDDMVTTEQLVTTPHDDPSNGRESETHSEVKHAPRPTDRRINGDAVMEMTSENKGDERVRDTENGGNVDGGIAGNAETNGGENVSLRKQTIGTKTVESGVEGSVNGHHRIVEGDVWSPNVSPALRKEDGVGENGQQSLSGELGLLPNKNELSPSPAQTGTEARVEDGDAFEKLTRVSDKEDVASNEVIKQSMEVSENDKPVNQERGLVCGKDDEVTANGLSQNGALMDKKKKSTKKDTGKTIAYSSRELRSYSDLDFDVNELVEIPEFGVESSGFGVRSAKSGARSSKFSDQFAWSKPAARYSKSGSKVSKSGARISDVTLSKGQSGNQASLSATEPATQETINKLSRLEEKLGVEFVSKLANSSAGKADSACTTKASQSAEGDADSAVTSEISARNVQLGSKMLNKKQVQETETDSIRKENGLGSEIPKPAIDQKWGRKQEIGALAVSESISKYFTNHASDQIEKQKQKVYHNFTEAKADYLKFKSNNADLKIGTCRAVSSSEALNLSQGGAANRLDVTLRDITCLLNELHRDQKTILSSVRQSVAKTDGEPESNIADGCDGNNGSKTQDLPVVDCRVTAENGSFAKSANEGDVTTVSNQKLDIEPSALSSDKDQLPTKSAREQNHWHDSVVAPIQENGEIKPSHPLRPVRKRRAPSEEKKRRGMAATLAIVQGRVEPITEEEQTPESEQTAKCLELDLKEVGSVSSDGCGENTDFVSHPKNRPCDKKSSVPDKKTSVLDLKSSVFESESGVPHSETDVSVAASGRIDGQKNEVGALIKAADSSRDEADGDEELVIQDGVVLRIKRTLVPKDDVDSLEDVSFGEEAEEHPGDDDDDDASDDDAENHTDDSESYDSDDDDDGDESYSDSECDSSESEPDFVEEDSGLCYRQGYSKVERLHTKWSKRPGVDTEVSAVAEIDLGVEKSIGGEPHSFEEQRCVDLSADTEVGPAPFDLSVRPKAPLSTAQEKSKSRNRHFEQTQQTFHDCHGDFQEQFESSGAFSGNHGNEYSKGFEDPDEFQEEQGHHGSRAADNGCHNNQYDQPRYPDGNYSDQYNHPEYQTGSFGNQYHQGYNVSYGNQHQYSYRGNHPTCHDYNCYQDSPYYQDYLYHMQEAERLEQKMKDEAFNKQMELYMHKAYVIQNMCMNQMKQYRHGKKQV